MEVGLSIGGKRAEQTVFAAPIGNLLAGECEPDFQDGNTGGYHAEPPRHCLKAPGKVADAKRLGAHEVVVSTDAAQMAAHAGSFDFILDAVSAAHDINAYLNLLKRDGNLTLVGTPAEPLPVASFPLLLRRRSFSGSLIGGLPETQEMLDFCGQHNITCAIEMIRMDQINEAYERMLKGDVKYRFVIDLASLA